MLRPPGRRRAAIARDTALGVVIALAVGLLVGLAAARPAFALAPCAEPVTGSGVATYYAYAPGRGTCTFAGDDDDALVAALNPVDFAGSDMCGRWLRVTGPNGSVTVRVVDLAPFMPPGGIDLNKPAFARIAPLGAGRVTVTWKTVASPEDESVSIHVDGGSNDWWAALQVRHHRYGIASLEFLGPRGYVPVPRTSWNRFVIGGGLGVRLPIAQPFTVRVTDVNGQQLVIDGLHALPGHEFVSGRQFPFCTGPAWILPPAVGAQLALLPPSPQPFGPQSTIVFEAPADTPVSLHVYDLAGRRVATVLDRVRFPAGYRTATWDGRGDDGLPVAGGTYLLRLRSRAGLPARSVLLTK